MPNENKVWGTVVERFRTVEEMNTRAFRQGLVMSNRERLDKGAPTAYHRSFARVALFYRG